MKHHTPIFYPKLSFYLFLYLLLLHVFAAVCLIATMSGVSLCLLLFVLFAAGIFYVCHYGGLLSVVRVDSLQYISDRKWRLWMVDETSREVVLAEKSIVTRYLMVLHFVEQNASTPSKSRWLDVFRNGNKGHVILLFPDSLSREQLKIIRRCAKLGMM